MCQVWFCHGDKLLLPLDTQQEEVGTNILDN